MRAISPCCPIPRTWPDPRASADRTGGFGCRSARRCSRRSRCSARGRCARRNFTVTNTADTGDGSLRDAIEDANAVIRRVEHDQFTLPANSTITLATALEDITSETLIFDATGARG